MTLSPKAEAWFESRAIDPEVVSRIGIYSGRWLDGAIEAHPAGDFIVFPYTEGGKEVAAKYRGKPHPDGSKNFRQKPNCKRTFFNADILDDPALIDGTAALVITEGEPDCLAVLSARYPFVVSVPDGAPPPIRTHDDVGNLLLPSEVIGPKEPRDISEDVGFRYVYNNWSRLEKIKRFVIFTDDDIAGRRLSEELIKRLGPARCSFVSYPDCKGRKPDANEVLIQYGAGEVLSMIANAKPVPLRGNYHMRDFPNDLPLAPKTTGFGRLDLPVQNGMAGLMLDRGLFMTVLGLPESGKSTWTTQLAVNLAKLHGWSVAIASFEMRRNKMYKLIQAAFTGKAELSRQEWDKADRFINEKFVFIHSGGIDDDPTVDWLLQCAQDAVIRDDIGVLIIDPWNEADHNRKPGESLTEYTGNAIKKIKRFALANNVLVIVVVHPTKEGAMKETLSMYDASDSSHWVNKPDLGVVFNRDYENGFVTVTVGKVRYRETGRRGSTIFGYVPELEIFSQ